MIGRMTRRLAVLHRLAPALAAVAGALTLLWLAVTGPGSHDEARQTMAAALRLAELRGEIQPRAEILTNAARLAAATGAGEWGARHAAAVPRFEAAIAATAALLGPEHAGPVALVEAANGALVAAERRAFALIEAGDTPLALALLGGAEYAALMGRYAAALDAVSQRIEQLKLARTGSLGGRAWLEGAAQAALAALLLLAAPLLAQRQRLRSALAETAQAARSDPLTGLANRRGLSEGLAAALDGLGSGAARDQMRPVALLLIDLDRFKAVNDGFGHEAGDRLLVEVAARLRGELRAGDAVARLGGDEFAAVLALPPAADPGEAALTVSRRIVARIEEPFDLGAGIVVRIGASVGVAVAPSDAPDAAGLLRAADAAMYAAKAEGRGRARAFDPALTARARARAALEAELRHALVANQFEPYFQPQFELSGRRLVGFEMLARWRHPERGFIPPVEFIPVAEEAGLIGAITERLVGEACRTAASWSAPVAIAVNISAMQLRDRSLLPQLRAALAASGLAPERLELELTESALVGDLDLAREVLEELSALGIRIALDDFGTGYSSLRHLKALPISRLKVDASFVRTMQTDPDSCRLVAGVLGLGQSLGLLTIAEGVEDVATAETLRAMGCDIGQGWLFGRPMPAAAARALVIAQNPGGLAPLKPALSS
jgi:diguanylate cyclase (GGDEF)-like protein